MKALLTLTALGIVAIAPASETFLISMPIADILGHREVCAIVCATGTERKIDRGYAWGQGLELGLGDRLEFGYDNDCLGSTLLNAKLQLGAGDDWAVSMGFNGATPGGRAANHYVVGRFDFANVRLHGGLLRNDRHRLMVGLDGDLGGGWSYMVDHISGPGSYTWLGLNMPVGQLCLTVAGGMPGRREDGVQHMISLTAYFKL